MEKPIKVSELNKYINKYLNMDYILGKIYVEGEITNFKEHSSGHLYFSLKDEYAKISCMMFHWKRKQSTLSLENGMKVALRGSVSLYEKEGQLQLYVEEVELSGMGDIYAQFLEVKKKLEEEGLFRTELKQKIPLVIQRIGVITSPEGAAIQDIINVSKRRNPNIQIFLYPVMVQGIYAPKQLIEGVRYFSKRTDIDLIIIGRGGGSYEDLMAFNDEALAREMFKCPVPILSAVGHETDFTISDFVADLRAPTPSAAAEMAILPLEDYLKQLDLHFHRLEREFLYRCHHELRKIEGFKNKLDLYHPKTISNRLRQKCEDTFGNSYFLLREKFLEEQRETDHLFLKLKEWSPTHQLRTRVYSLESKRKELYLTLKKSLIEKEKELSTLYQRLYQLKESFQSCSVEGPKGFVESVSQVQIGDTLRIYTSDGKILSEVKGIHKYGE